MKIRNKHLVRAAGWLASRVAHGLVSTLNYRYRCLGTATLPIAAIPPGPRYAYSLWHENILLPIGQVAHPDVAVLISKHADGQILSTFIRSAGLGIVLGSTNRGGIEAVRSIVNGTAGRRHLVVTPDGPRGPRRVVQAGIVYIASRTGMAIVPVGIGYFRPWRAKSWDKFAVPKPGSRARQIHGVPISVPPKLRADELEPYRLIVQSEMDRLTTLAEHWATTNRSDVSSEPVAQA